MAVVPVVPIAVIAQRNRIIRRFGDARGPEKARTLAELGLTQSHILRRMIRSGVIREEAGDRFWLDESAHAAFRRRVMASIAIALGVAAVVVVAMVLLGR